jgi:ribonuclease HI
MDNIKLYTDGACSGNPGPGGWAAIIINGDYIHKISGSDKSTTNNRMEIIAVIEGLKMISDASRVEVITDSAYVVNTMTKGWKRNKNQDLWNELDALVFKRDVKFTWVKGHASNQYNNECDKMAVLEYQKYKV